MGFKVYLQIIIAEVNHKNKSDVRKNFITEYVYTHKDFELVTGAPVQKKIGEHCKHA